MLLGGSADDGIMTGMSSMEVEVQLVPGYSIIDQQAAASRAAGSFERLVNGTAFLASETGDRPASDYDRFWVLATHPTTFPNGVGYRPKGMSEDAYAGILARRPGTSTDPRLQCNLYDVLQRHKVNVQTRVSLDGSPAQLARIGTLAASDLSTVMNLLSTTAQGEQRAALFANAPPAVLALLQMIRVSGARVEGSPASLASMRKCAVGLRDYYGPWTTFVTLNPSELQSQVVTVWLWEGCNGVLAVSKKKRYSDHAYGALRRCASSSLATGMRSTPKRVPRKADPTQRARGQSLRPILWLAHSSSTPTWVHSFRLRLGGIAGRRRRSIRHVCLAGWMRGPTMWRPAPASWSMCTYW